MILTFALPNVRAQVGSGNVAAFGFSTSGNAPVAATGFSHENYIAISPNQLAVRFGFRSLGQSSGNVAPPPPTTSSVGWRWVTGPSRKKLVELYDAVKAERELRERLKKKKKVAEAVREAAEEAAEAIQAAELAPPTEQLDTLLADLSKSLNAITTSTQAMQARAAIEIARRVKEEIALREDDEEAMLLLLGL